VTSFIHGQLRWVCKQAASLAKEAEDVT